jgi:hypothetical protein
MMTGQSFRLYKNFKIKDMGFTNVNQDKLSGNMVMLEFTPNIQDKELFSSDFWGDFSEDTRKKTLTIKLSTKGEVERSPYIVCLNVSSRKNITFNIATSSFADSNQSLNWYNMLLKIKRLEYRRVYVEDYSGTTILTSACPIMDEFPPNKYGEYLRLLAELEDKTQEKFFPTFNFDNRIFDFISSFVSKWESLKANEHFELVEKVKSILANTKSTLVTVNLKLKNNDFVPTIITHHLHWYNYKNFNLEFTDKNQRFVWNEIVRSQSEIMFNVNARSLFPNEFFSKMIEKRSKGVLNHLTIINDLLHFDERELPDLKTNIAVHFLNPTGNLQEIRITIAEVDNDLNILDKLLINNNYIDAIPYLEKLELHPETLAYAYTLKGEFDTAINLANELIHKDLDTVAHMTKGMALLGKGNINKAYEAYRLGINVVTAEWYPIAKQNLREFLINNNINETEEIKSIINLLSIKKKPISPSKRCYCGSSKSLRKCHGDISKII